MEQTAIDVAVRGGRADASAPPRDAAPLGGEAQLRLLAQALAQAAAAIAARSGTTAAVMASHSASDVARAAAVGDLRRLLWQASRELLPLAERIPPGLRHGGAYQGCLAAHHQLRRLLDEVRRGLAGWQIDLAVAGNVLPSLRDLRTHVR